ncbi:hypothetical protein CC80DRAFT_481183 [Byssothecium circinans]|uniref:Probable pectate lyase F n=1 Tax=Byssothecium circinans TaxID=147558 RepID=A0A6A5TGN3_9PLEO|nr:hypothetical protein CC80DRAFT_481183 [Byssothecium circinans]
MQFSLKTIAAVAAILAAVDAAPPKGRRGPGFYPAGGSAKPTGVAPGSDLPSGFPVPSGGAFPTAGFGPGSKGKRPSGYPPFGIPIGAPSGKGKGKSPGDTGEDPPFNAPEGALPTGGAGFPGFPPAPTQPAVRAARSSVTKRADSSKPSKSTKTKPSSSSKAGAAAPGKSSSTSTPTTGGSGSNSTSPSGGGSKASSTFPKPAGESTLSEPMQVTGSFDGKNFRFGRGVACGGGEGGAADAVFNLAEGATLSNVIIGADQTEGVHCQGACTLENVWWEAVCEDAFTIKLQDASATTNVKGGGAKGAKDKVFQHNGAGTLHVSDFYFEDFGKAYRSCGNCKTQNERHVVMDGVIATGGSSAFIGINPNYGDTATITNSCIKMNSGSPICEEFEGTDNNSVEPKVTGEGISASCIYTDAAVTAC